MAQEVNTRSGSPVWGGVMLSILGNINFQEINRTIVLAAIGTITSFIVSAILKKLSGKHRRSKSKTS